MNKGSRKSFPSGSSPQNVFFVDWTCDMAISSEVPRSTSESKIDDDEAAPPLPSKHRNVQEEQAAPPRSGKQTVAQADAGNHTNDNNCVDRPIPLPRLKTISGGQASPGSQV